MQGALTILEILQLYLQNTTDDYIVQFSELFFHSRSQMGISIQIDFLHHALKFFAESFRFWLKWHFF